MGRCCTCAGYRGRCRSSLRGYWGEGSVDQGVLERTVPVEGGQARGGEYVSGGSISLEVAEMASDDLLDVDAGGIVVKDKGNPIAVVEGKRGGEGGSVGDREGSSIYDIIDISATELWMGARIELEQGMFHIPHKEA
eukprot:g22399.t1